MVRQSFRCWRCGVNWVRGMVIVCHIYINGLGRKGKNGMGWRIVPTGLGGSACLCGCDTLRLVFA
jgi:hypothetical protein